MFISNNILGNCDDGIAYTRVQSLEHSLVLKHPCSLDSEFHDLSATKDIFKPKNSRKICIEQMFILVNVFENKTQEVYLHVGYNLF